jgi:hypothetical protein
MKQESIIMNSDFYKKPKSEIIVDRVIIGLLAFKAIWIVYLISTGGL